MTGSLSLSVPGVTKPHAVVRPKVIETTDPNDYEKNITQFVSEGYNVIVTVGFNLGEQTVAAAKANLDHRSLHDRADAIALRRRMAVPLVRKTS